MIFSLPTRPARVYKVVRVYFRARIPLDIVYSFFLLMWTFWCTVPAVSDAVYVARCVSNGQSTYGPLLLAICARVRTVNEYE